MLGFNTNVNKIRSFPGRIIPMESQSYTVGRREVNVHTLCEVFFLLTWGSGVRLCAFVVVMLIIIASIYMNQHKLWNSEHDNFNYWSKLKMLPIYQIWVDSATSIHSFSKNPWEQVQVSSVIGIWAFIEHYYLHQ